MKALVTGFHMLYRLSPDSKYPWSGENTGPIEIPVLNIPLLGSWALPTKLPRGSAARQDARGHRRSARTARAQDPEADLRTPV